MIRRVLVEFVVIVKDKEDFTQYQASEYVAERLSISLMLKELNVGMIKVGSHEFNLEARRNRDRRFTGGFQK